jgi:hypothetical protein
MSEIVPCYLSLLFLARAHFTAGQWVDVGYEHVITKESYYQLFRFDPLLIFFCHLLFADLEASKYHVINSFFIEFVEC